MKDGPAHIWLPVTDGLGNGTAKMTTALINLVSNKVDIYAETLPTQDKELPLI